VEVVAGNIATAEGARALIAAGRMRLKWGLVRAVFVLPALFGLRRAANHRNFGCVQLVKKQRTPLLRTAV